MSTQARVLTRVTGPMENNCYAVWDEGSSLAAVIDPGIGGAAILDDLPAGVRVQMVLLTHGHFDHLADVGAVVARTGARVGLHPADEDIARQAPQYGEFFGIPVNAPSEVDFQLSPDIPLGLGSLQIEVRHVPGHSPGGVAFVVGDIVFTGDCLFAGSIGRTDLPGGDHRQLLNSIQSCLLSLPDETAALSGHGPATTIGQERLTNPFLIGL